MIWGAAISKHLKNIFEENELDEQEVVFKMETTSQHGAIEGKTQKPKESTRFSTKHNPSFPISTRKSND